MADALFLQFAAVQTRAVDRGRLNGGAQVCRGLVRKLMAIVAIEQHGRVSSPGLNCLLFEGVT